MKRLTIALILCMALCSCSSEGWTAAEKQLVCSADSTMRVLTVDSPADSLVLREVSSELSREMVASDVYARLSELMLATVQSPSQRGVGIAGPQVGISRRVVAVKRYDKAGEPFEVYPNIRITAFRGEAQQGPEGCLSVPGRRGIVNRWYDIDIAYTSPVTLKDTTETIQGFTAVIFQHECDHLEGIIYTDKTI